MTRIALSYRQSDTYNTASRLSDILDIRYKNVAPIRPSGLSLAASVHDYVEQQLRACDVLLAIVGSDWVGKKPDGTRRIDQPTDYVRLGVQTALQWDIPVIPVLVEGTELPKVEELPDDLQDLDRYPPVNVDVNHGFGKSVGLITGYIDEVVSSRQTDVPRSAALKETLHHKLRWRPRLPNLNVSRFLRRPKAIPTVERGMDRPAFKARVALQSAKLVIMNVIAVALVVSGVVMNSSAEALAIQFGNLPIGLGVLLFLICNSYYSVRLLFSQRSTA